MKKIFALTLTLCLLLCGCNEVGEVSTPEISSPSVSDTSEVSVPSSEASEVSEESVYVPVNHFVKGETTTEGSLSYDFSPTAAQAEFDTLTNFINTLYFSGKFEYPPFASYPLEGSYSGKATDRFSFVYIDLETGCKLSYDTGKQYQTCSVIKPSLAVYLLKSGMDLQKEITITSYAGGSGVLTKADIGKSYTVEYLMQIMITESDNTAYTHLLKHDGKTSQQAFSDYLASIGVEALNVGAPTYYKFGLITAHDLAVMMEDIYKYSLEDTKGMKVLEYMQNTSYNELITSIDGSIPVAHKYGEDNGIEPSLHDAAIYLGEHPYVLVILSTSDVKKVESYDKFKAITLLVNEFHSAMHGYSDAFSNYAEGETNENG